MAPADEIPSSSSSASACSGYGRWFILIQICNSIVIGVLIAAIVFLFGQIELLNYRLGQNEDQVSELEIQVQEKQQGQIQQLNEEVQEEHNLTLNTLAGTLTLLTCLISMFHMSSHLRNYVEPTVQRKIVAILWMSPIYSCTSLFSLLIPPVEGYLAIIKDFYESYCIYTFLSFLIAVLGRGDRNLVVQVLAKHADHLETPTRWLSRWYNPPPETSDQAKANAVITECQIMCMQFVFIRPLTSIASFVLASMEDTTASAATSSTMTAFSSPTPSLVTMPPSSFLDNSTRMLGEDGHDGITATATSNPIVYNDTFSYMDDTNSTDFFSSYTEDQRFEDATKAYFKSAPFYIAMVINVSVFFAFTALLKFYHAVQKDLEWCKPWPKFLTVKGVVFVTFWQGLIISIVLNLKQSQDNNTIDDAAYYDDDDDNNNNDDMDPSDRAMQLQNVLICLEMLFFSITHWCVFPAEEWERDFKPKEVVGPGIGIKDFVSDVSHLVNSRRRGGTAIEMTSATTRTTGSRRTRTTGRNRLVGLVRGDGLGNYQDADGNISLQSFSSSDEELSSTSPTSINATTTTATTSTTHATALPDMDTANAHSYPQNEAEDYDMPSLELTEEESMPTRPKIV